MPQKSRGKPFVKGDPRAGRKKGIPNKATGELREFAQRILESEEYRESVRRRVIDGASPKIEELLYFYAYGKPADTLDLSNSDGTLKQIIRLYVPPNGRN
jgi:hypothetical protein